MSDPGALRQNIRRYPWYAAFHNAFFWMPVFFLYFSEHLDLGGILTLEAIYYVAVVVLEVPSGYVSDRYGRRRTLIASSGLLVGAYTLFAFADSFGVFALAQIGLAGGIAFQSGTGTSFHYDSLAASEQADEYEDREGIVTRNSLAATALAAVVGGLASSWDLRSAYVLSAAAALAAFATTLSFREPPTDESDRPVGFAPQLVDVLGQLRRPALAWLFAYAVAMTVLNHIPYEFYQPYLKLAGRHFSAGETAPIVTGLHMGATTLLGAAVARRGVELDHRIGTGPTLLVATAVQTSVIVGMAALLHPLVALLILLRGLPKALAAAPLRAAVTPRLPKRQRATYLSVQSLVGRLGFAGLLGSLGAVAGSTSPDSWATLSMLLWICSGLALALLATLATWLALTNPLED